MLPEIKLTAETNTQNIVRESITIHKAEEY